MMLRVKGLTKLIFNCFKTFGSMVECFTRSRLLSTFCVDKKNLNLSIVFFSPLLADQSVSEPRVDDLDPCKPLGG